MDSPPDLSPNAPPAGIEDPATFFANLQGQPIPSQPGTASTEGSVDSSGFEKVDHDVLEEYGHNFAQQMQKSIFGKLPEDPDSQTTTEDDGFVIIEKTMSSPTQTPTGIQLLHRIPGDIDKPYPQEKPATTKSHPAEEVTMADKHHAEEGALIDIPSNSPPPPTYEEKAHSPEHYHHEDLPKRSESPLIPEPAPRHEDHHHAPEPVHSHEEKHGLPQEVPIYDEKNDFTHDPVPSYEEKHDHHAHDPAPAYEEKPHHHAYDPVPSYDDKHEHVYEPEPHHEEKQKQPAVEDLLDFGETAKELVDEAVREADDKIHQQSAHVYDNVVEAADDDLDNVHDEVDDLIDQMNENDEFQEEVRTHRRPSEEEEQPDFRHTPELDEPTYERNGPLTIPELPEKNEAEEVDDVPPPPMHRPHHGFETEPRPPTPPKDISDEDMKPSLVHVGQGHTSHTHTPGTGEPRHSILKHSAAPWCDFKTVDPCVLDLIYWRDPKKSAIALSLSLLAVFILAKYPLLSIISYAGLAVLAGTLGFRVFKAVEGQIKKTGGENPFQEYLNKDLNVPQDKVHAQVDVLVEHAVCMATKAKKLVFVENIVDSVKFVLILWSMTYVSAWFSGFGLVVLTILGIFSLPKVYETYQEPIDAHLEIISGHLNNVLQLVEEKLPFLKRAAVEAEKKEQ